MERELIGLRPSPADQDLVETRVFAQERIRLWSSLAALLLGRSLWDEIARTHEVDILCGYVLNSFQLERESHIYERICAEHSAVSSQ
jgi:hypothetical protein